MIDEHNIEEIQTEVKQKKQFVFGDFSLDQLYEQIVQNSRENRKQLKQTITRISGQIEDVTDIQLLSPQVSSYMTLMVKNDQILLKLATALSKINENRKQGKSEEEDDLSQKEKRQLIEQVNRQVNPLFKRIKQKVNN